MKTTEPFDYESAAGGFSFRCRFKTSRYLDNGNLALMMVDAEDEEPVCVATVNPGEKIADNYIAVKDYSENEGMADFLKKIGIIHPDPLKLIPSGWVAIPVYELTESGKDLFEGV